MDVWDKNYTRGITKPWYHKKEHFLSKEEVSM